MSMEEFLTKLNRATLIKIIMRIASEFVVINNQLNELKENFEQWYDTNKD